MLTKRAVQKLEILDDGVIQVRDETVIEEDGIEIARVYHREALAPSNTIPRRTQRLVDIAQVVWTPDVVAAYADKIQRAKETPTTASR